MIGNFPPAIYVGLIAAYDSAVLCHDGILKQKKPKNYNNNNNNDGHKTEVNVLVFTVYRRRLLKLYEITYNLVIFSFLKLTVR